MSRRRIPAGRIAVEPLHGTRRDAVRWARGLTRGPVGRMHEDTWRDLAEPARDYLRATVPPGAPALTAALIGMRGSIRIGGRWRGFRAREVLAPAHGFTWAARVAGIILGSDRLRDGEGTLAWRTAGLIPVARAAGPEVARSAAGRCAAEGVWLPSAMTPGAGVDWGGEDGPAGATAIARVPVAGCETQTIRIHLDAGGAPTGVTSLRFGNPTGHGPAGVHPFGMHVVALGRPAGLLIPTKGRVGWFPTADGFADDGEFFRYRITDLTPLA